MPQFRAQRRVEFRDTDAAGIVHFSVFFTYMEAAEHAMLRSVDLSVVQKDPEGTITWPRVAARADYQSAIRFEDLVDIEVHVSRLGQKSVTYEFAFSCAGRQVATGEITAVCCRLHGDGTLSSMAVPPDIAAKLRSFLL